MVGRTLVSGRYVEIAYPSGAPEWNAGDFHALDYGLEIDFDDGSTWSFIWDQVNVGDSLLAYEGPLLGDQLATDSEFAKWPIADIPEWRAALGRRVSAVTNSWHELDDGLCPMTWCLHFEGLAWVAVTVGAADADGSFRLGSDDVALFFDRSIAATAGVPLPTGS